LQKRLEGLNQIVQATLRGTEQEVLFALERKVIFDIYYRNERGEHIIVEMQKSGDDSFKDRMLFYASTAIRKVVMSGEAKVKLPKVYLPLAIWGPWTNTQKSSQAPYLKNYFSLPKYLNWIL